MCSNLASSRILLAEAVVLDVRRKIRLNCSTARLVLLHSVDLGMMCAMFCVCVGVCVEVCVWRCVCGGVCVEVCVKV